MTWTENEQACATTRDMRTLQIEAEFTELRSRVEKLEADMRECWRKQRGKEMPLEEPEERMASPGSVQVLEPIQAEVELKELRTRLKKLEVKLAEYEQLVEAQGYDIPSSLKKLYTINERRNRLAVETARQGKI